MSQILISFLCGTAFIGGAVATTCLVALAAQLKDSKGRAEIREYWQRSVSHQEKQLLVLAEIAAAIKDRKKS